MTTESKSEKTNWISLDSLGQLKKVSERSFERPIVIFKHSTSCGISARAHYQLEGGWDLISDKVDLYYLDLLSYRDISNTIAEQYNVRHQSPQLLLIKDGELVFSTSHHEVNVESVVKALVL